jgi:hypothetical protein
LPTAVATALTALLSIAFAKSLHVVILPFGISFNPSYALDFYEVVLMLCDRNFIKFCSYTLLVIQKI